MSRMTAPRPPRVGELLRDWRTRRNRSQLDLSLDAGVSARHLSFVETGRSRPSPELVLALAEHLAVPLRERNQLLLAAGYAPRFAERTLDDDAMRHVRASLDRMLRAHDPYPGVVIDRAWNVVLANESALLLARGVAPELVEPRLNVFRVCLHPDGLAPRTRNFAEWAGYLLGQLRRAVTATGDPTLAALLDEVTAYPTVAALGASGDRGGVGGDDGGDPAIVVPFRFLADDGRELSLFTTLTTFGTPRDVTLDEIALELFFPADDATARLLSR